MHLPIAKPYLFPEDLFGRPNAVSSASSRWWVLCTRPGAEKVLARRLWRRQISFFLPLYEKRVQHQCRSQVIYLPLFPGYLFLHGDSEARLRALQSNLISQCLWVEDQEQLQSDLARIYHCLETGQPLAPETGLEQGTWVEVTAGPLTGTRGRLVERGERLKFIVEVQFLQQVASLEIDSRWIQPVIAEPEVFEPITIDAALSE
jgi:hypothetical protein